jgi:predicted dehydrogenase
MEQQKPLRTAVIGTGAISDIYIQNMIKRFSIIDVVGCSSRNEKTAEEKAKKYNIKYLKQEEIWKDPTIEMVVNLTPPEAHGKIIRSALSNGKHVFTEKVITVTFEEAKELVSLARENNLYLGSAPDTFLGSAVQTARDIIESGMIGDVTSVLISMSRDMEFLAELLPFLNGPGAGIGFDLGIYYITAVVSIIGPVKEVCGMRMTYNKERKLKEITKPGFRDTFTLINENQMGGTLVFENGAMGSIHINGDTIFPEQPMIKFYGTDGILMLPDPNAYGGEIRLLRKGASEAVIIPALHGFDEDVRGIGPAEMAWAIRKGRESRVGAELGLHCLEILYGISQSSETKKFYTLTTTYKKMSPLPKGFMKMGNENFMRSEEGALVW